MEDIFGEEETAEALTFFTCSGEQNGKRKVAHSPEVTLLSLPEMLVPSAVCVLAGIPVKVRAKPPSASQHKYEEVKFPDGSKTSTKSPALEDTGGEEVKKIKHHLLAPPAATVGSLSTELMPHNQPCTCPVLRTDLHCFRYPRLSGYHLEYCF